MKYVMAFGSRDLHSQPLEDGATRQSVAEECRDAALSFTSGVAVGWDKLDLALWLTGAYARATRHDKHGERVPVPHAGDETEISDESIETLVTRVRGQTIASLEKAALEFGSLEFANEIVARGLVRRVVDSEGREAWIPIDAPRVRLRDRVRSLFVADYLNVPYAYAELFVCHRCEAIVFDARAKRIGICGSHRMSGVVTRDEAPASVPTARSAR